jgi:hypothetical protein
VILETAQQLLETAGYDVFRNPGDEAELLFEDASLLGLLCVCPSAGFIAENWRRRQDRFLRETAQALRNSPEKAWNTYLVLLTTEATTDDHVRTLAMIEEDFTAMRKIAMSGVLSENDVLHALAPLLPTRTVTVPNERLVERLQKALALSEGAFGALVRNEPELLTSLLLEDK